MKFDSFNPMENITVTTEMVAKCEDDILKELKCKKYVYVNILSKYIPTQFIYNLENYNSEIEKLSSKISLFMAYQEAFINLMNKGEIMPLELSNTGYAYNSTSINIEQIESHSRTTSTRNLQIPLIPYKSFMRVPSKWNL